jgi:hypothetical protein
MIDDDSFMNQPAVAYERRMIALALLERTIAKFLKKSTIAHYLARHDYIDGNCFLVASK